MAPTGRRTMTEMQPQPASEASSSVMTVTEFTGLLALIAPMLTAMEGRIIGRLNENSDLAKERWERHDSDSKRTLAAIEERFGGLETALNGHLDAERVEDVAQLARIQPVKSAAGFIGRNWRSIALAIASILGILGLAEGKL